MKRRDWKTLAQALDQLDSAIRFIEEPFTLVCRATAYPNPSIDYMRPSEATALDRGPAALASIDKGIGNKLACLYNARKLIVALLDANT